MEDHCCAMALFASQIVIEFDRVVEELALLDEDSGGLGQDTALLRLRAGCHSGPVTAGVLRGDKGRFQLFGDTVNTAARMESNGQAGRVQISEQMANVLACEGKSHWYTPREDKITAKGKGELQTYWLKEDLMGQCRLDKEQPQPRKQYVASLWRQLDDVNNIQVQQLTEWNFQQLEILIKKIVAMNVADVSVRDDGDDGVLHYEEHDGTILDELEIDANVISNLIPACSKKNVNYESVVLPPKVVLELLAFVKAIATNFQSNPFHNFQHSCHMIRSMIKLMDELNKGGSSGKASNVLAQDPLAQFVVILTCMVQDVDNPGVTNEQLMQEDADMAEYFNRTCLQRKCLIYLCLVSICVYTLRRLTLVSLSKFLEQNALDVAWELLVGETCENLLQVICSHSAMELERFRKYMVHAMMATDREDHDLLLARFKRWKEVSSPRHSTNRRNNSGPPSWLQSIVSIEQFVQLSNQIHNAQAPEFFSQWNERYFREQYLAYINGRREQDPCEHYYKTLLHLFRKTIVPLTERYSSKSGQKKNNGMLGKCEELSQQAKRNMEEWEREGEAKLSQLASAAKYEFGEKQAAGELAMTSDEPNRVG
jgi:transcription termination factor NusB